MSSPLKIYINGAIDQEGAVDLVEQKPKERPEVVNKRSTFGAVHVVLPDTQVAPGVPTEHLSWAGRYIRDQFGKHPDLKIIHLGDHWTMDSLSSYDRGKRSFAPTNYADDVESGNKAFALLNKPLENVQARKILLRGNHESRIERAADDMNVPGGSVSLDHLESPGWEVHDFLHVVEVDGIAYSHFFANPMTGKPYSGMIETRIKTVGRSFTMGHQQGLRYGMIDGYAGLPARHGLVAGSFYCLTPDHRVLTSDLRYIPLGDVKVGDALVSFDESVSDSVGRSRRYKTGIVEKTTRDTAEVFAVRLSNGDTLKTTADHKWLSRVGGGMYTWRTTASLRARTRVTRPLETWDTDLTREGGWLAGIYDGEGCLYERSSSGHQTVQLSVSQKPGLVATHITKALLEHGFEVSTDKHPESGVLTWRIRGGQTEIARFLGTVRPERLLGKFRPELLGRISTIAQEQPFVLSVEPLGVMPIVRIAVDAKTMIVDGYAHHNCHDEAYRGPQATQEWRGIVVCHQVVGGTYDIMLVSLDYLRRRYA